MLERAANDALKRLAGCTASVAILVFALAVPAAAQFYHCREPDVPNCIDGIGSRGPFDDDYEFSSCKRETEQYLSDLDSWADCVMQAASSDAANKADEAVELFNCRAEERMICY